jgi:hypothetical protein
MLGIVPRAVMTGGAGMALQKFLKAANVEVVRFHGKFQHAEVW